MNYVPNMRCINLMLIITCSWIWKWAWKRRYRCMIFIYSLLYTRFWQSFGRIMPGLSRFLKPAFLWKKEYKKSEMDTINIDKYSQVHTHIHTHRRAQIHIISRIQSQPDTRLRIFTHMICTLSCSWTDKIRLGQVTAT